MEEPEDLEQRTREILEMSFDAFLEVDRGCIITDWNTGAANLFGWERCDAIGKHASMLVPERHRGVFSSDLEKIVAEGPSYRIHKPVRARIAHRDSREFPTELILYPRKHHGDYRVSVFVRDLTERRRLENALREIEDQRAILNFVEDGYTELDLRGNTLFVNDAYCRIFNRTREEALDPQYTKVSHNPVSTNIRELFKQVYRTGEPIKGFEYEYRPGRFCEITLSLKRSKDGQPTGFITITRETTQRKQYEQELARAKEAAEAASKAKSEFLANMSHEIRTPMNAVIGMTSLLLDMDLQGESREFVETIRNSSDSLLTIINDILDFSKIESGNLELEDQPFELLRCAEEAVDLLAAQAAQKKIELILEVDAGVPQWILGDVTRLRQVLVNLVANAVKFTAAGEVVVSIRQEPNAAGDRRLRFAIRDTGPGIPADRMNRLFRSFSQVDASTTRRHGGTGLGLAISARLTDLMGGQIGVESEPGRGSTFHFTLPERIAEGYVPATVDFDKWSGQRILIVDDNPTNRRVLELQLSHWRLSPVTAASPREALEILKSEQFPLALVDYEMPDMNGLQLVRAIAAMNLAPGMPVVVLSSSVSAMRELLPGDGDRPFAAFLTKPAKSRHLAEVIAHFLTGRQPMNSRNPSPDVDTTLARRQPLRILLAEDNVVNQKVAVRLLERFGYRPDVASNGFEVLAAVQRQAYDVVLLDIQMPEMDGIEAAHRITKQFELGKRPRLIALTANVLKDDRDLCADAGMDDFIAKPVHVADLQQALLRCSRVNYVR